jgi:hypothetical protein
METLEKDAFELPQINSWAVPPSREQIRYATDLCRSELPYAERVATINTLSILDSRAVSELIAGLAAVRDRRRARLRQARPTRRRR